ncbi:MAG: hypothetical protein HZB38_00855 [Planctomycetes bacterium]|nr:hypothetical protein [Planctomycetota bacterium]
MNADNWRNRCGGKLTSAARAIEKIRPGDSVFLSAGSASPRGIYPALMSPQAATSDVRITHLLTLGEAPYVAPEYAARFRHNALFIGSNVRAAVAEGRADYTPVFLSEIPGLIRAGRIPVDVAIVSVSPPDSEGNCSFGTHIDLNPSACEMARTIIAVVNTQMPRTFGPHRLPIDRVHAVVEVDLPLPELPAAKIRGETEQIARNIADLVPDGATLQLGIGGIPDAVLRFLGERKHIGIHTEMFSDGVADLVKRGVIDGSRKSLHPGKIVASFVLGSKACYEFLHENQMVEMHTSD